MVNSFVEIDKESYDILSDIKASQNCNNLKKADQNLFNELVEAKFIVTDDNILLNNLKIKSYMQRFDNKRLSLTIAPTLYCNFNCPYCFEQNRQNISMSDDTEDRLIELIKNYSGITNLHITWYGGEPLIAFDRIKSITKRLKQIEKKFVFDKKSYALMDAQGIQKNIITSLKKMSNKYFLNEQGFWQSIMSSLGNENTSKFYSLIKSSCSRGYPFSASMISNGYLLTKEKVDELEELNIRKIQITLDGNEDTHNQRRNVKTGNSYQIILKNLDYLLKTTNNVQIAFRVSVDNTNHEQYAEVHNMLVKRYKNKNMFIYPGFIQDAAKINEGCASIEGCYMDREKKAEFLMGQVGKLAPSGNQLYYPRINPPECMARRINSLLIDAKGDIYKCWDDIGVKEKVITNLHNKDNKNINIELFNKYLVGNDAYSNTDCLECFYLPICGGGCANMRIHNADTVDVCVVTKDKIDVFLETHYEDVKRRRKEKQKTV